MKTLTIPRIKSLAELEALPWEAVDNNNWADFAKAPETKVKIARLNDAVVVKFEVMESNPRAVNTADGQPVYEDSCVEFFCHVPGDEKYQNYEFNSRGKLLASRRASRTEAVEPRTEAELARISRYPQVNASDWTLMAVIPADLIGLKPDTTEITANFYKCGDLTEHPHFASWNPIDTPAPDFHRPEFFGKACL